jgi:cyclase
LYRKRIIPCLDIKNGKVVKGVQFEDLCDAGDPVSLARRYCLEGADEVVLLDISASLEGKGAILGILKKAAEQVLIPLTVGGGVQSIDDVRDMLEAGANKVSMNSGAVACPELIREAARRFGSERIVIAVDAKKCSNGRWEVYTNGGTRPTGLDVIEWCRQAVNMGAGEVLLTSMDRDGTTIGFDIELTRTVSSSVKAPVIASGGAGTPEHFVEVLTSGGAQAALAASVFHYSQLSVKQVKEALRRSGVPVR